MKLFFLFLIFAVPSCLALFPDYPNSLYHSALLGSGSPTASQRMGFFQNPASIKPNHFGILVDYERPFSMQEIGQSSVLGFWDFKTWGISLGYHQFSVHELYLEQTLDLQGSWIPHKWIIIGSRAKFRRLEISRFSYTTLPGDGIGVLFFPHNKFSLGVYLADYISQPWISYQLSPIQGWGWKWKPFESYQITYSLTKRRNKKWQQSLGHQLALHKSICFFSALANDPFQFSLGIKISLSGIHLLKSARLQNMVGTTHHHSLAAVFNRN